MIKWVDENALQYFRKRTEVQSTGNTITVSEKSNKSFPSILTKSDIDVNLDNIIDNNTILKNNNKLKSGLTLAKITTGLPTKVKERYALKDNQGNVIGSEINIYYDSSLVEVYLGNTDDRLTNVPDPSTGKNYTIVKSVSGEDALCFVFVLDTGLYELVSVPVGDFLRESEFKDGLNVSNHEVSAKISDGLEFGNAGIGVNKPVKVKLHNKYVSPSLANGISVLNVNSNGLSLDLENLLQRSFKSSSYINLVLTQAEASPLGTGQVLLPILQPEANVVTISSATSQNNGLVTANDVKQYLEGQGSIKIQKGTDGFYFNTSVVKSTDSVTGGTLYTIKGDLDIVNVENSGPHQQGDIVTIIDGLAHSYDVKQYIEGNTYWRSDGTYQTSGIYTTTNTASGTYSVAEGYDSTASANYSHAEGCQTAATGLSSHAEGESTTASGDQSHVEGNGATASGDISHAEGNDTSARGDYSHAEGYATMTSGESSHVEGSDTYALGDASHAEGQGFITKSNFTISGLANSTTYQSSTNHGLSKGIIIERHVSSEDKYRFATIVNVLDNTHFVVDKTLDDTQNITNEYIYRLTGVSYGNYSHSEGNNTVARGMNSHAEGDGTIAQENNSHAEGGSTTASGINSHAEGGVTIASGTSSHAEGDSTAASGASSHAEGSGSEASGVAAHAEGYETVASGENSHAEGADTVSSGLASHVEGYGPTASGDASHAEGCATIASGYTSHAEGYQTTASEECSHAEGSDTIANGNAAHSEGAHTTAWGDGSHVEGGGSVIRSTFTISGSAGIKGYVSSQDHGLVVGSVIKYNNRYATVVEVTNSTHFTLDHTLDSDAALTNVYVDIITGISYGNCSHVENRENIAVGASSHAEGLHTIANNDNEHACGKYNLSTPNQTLFSIGNGTSDSDRHNVFEVTQDGSIIGGSFSSGTSTQTINTSDTAPVVTKSESIILLNQDSRIPPFLDLESFSMSPGQHVTIFLTNTFSSLSVSLILGYSAYIYTQGNVDYKLGPEVHNITAQYSKIDIIRISTHQWTITLY